MQSINFKNTKTHTIAKHQTLLQIFIVILTLFVIVLSTTSPAYAITPQEQQLLNQQLILQQQQEQRRQQEQNRLQIDDIENIRRTRVGSDGIESIDGNDGVGGGTNGNGAGGSSSTSNCIKFNRIELIGNTIYSTKYLQRKVLNKYIDKCINKKNIDDMTNSLMKIYIDKGYSTTRVYFDISKLRSDNIFIFVIDEGKVNDIVLNNIYPEKKSNKKLNKKEESKKESKNTENKKDKDKNKDKTNKEHNTINKEQNKPKEDKTSFLDKYKSFRLKSQTFFAFPFLKGKEFNLRDFEQGLDQLNRLQSNNATLDIRAVQEIKNEELGIKNEPSAENQRDKNKSNKAKSNKSTLTKAKPNKSKTSSKISDDLISASDIIINNQKSSPISFSIGLDNSGNKSTGENLANINLSVDNLIGIDDNIYLKYTQDTDTENNKRYNKSFYSNLSFPLGYWTFNTSINYSKYLTTINGYYTSFHTSGNTLTQMYNIDRVLFRRQLFKINAGTNLTVRDTESYIRNLKSITGSRKSSNINLYLNNIIYTRLGTIIIKPSYQKGLDWFNSKKDDNHNLMLKTEPKLQYDMVKLYVYYNTRINLPLFTKTQVIDPNTNQPIMVEREIKNVKLKIKNEKLNKKIKNKPSAENQRIKNKESNKEPTTQLVPLKVRNKINLNYTLTFDSQYSWDTLYGTDQFSIGGEYTVRGFREGTISGDNGYYIRNDLSINLQQLFPKFILNSKIMSYGSNTNISIKGKNLRLSLNDFLSKAYISIFYDYGYVQDKYSDDSDTIYNSQSGYMAGAGIALNYYGQYLNWSLTYAKALHAPNYLQSRDGIKKEGHSVYWRIGGRF